MNIFVGIHYKYQTFSVENNCNKLLLITFICINNCLKQSFSPDDYLGIIITKIECNV